MSVHSTDRSFEDLGPTWRRRLDVLGARLRDSWRSGVVFFNDLRRLLARIVDPDVPDGGLYTYFVAVPTPQEKYGPGSCGVAQTICNTTYQVIDFQVICRASTFRLTSFFIGDVNMMLGVGWVPADMFFPSVQNRFVRFTEVERGQTVQIGFTNSETAGEPEPICIVLKVRAKRRS